MRHERNDAGSIAAAEAPCLAPLGPEHLDGAVALSRAEGWPHRREDWALILSGSRGVVALQDGRVVASAMATAFGPVATLNMVLVDRSLRGRGLGRRIVGQAMARAVPREWRLVATQDGLPLYRRLGFEPCGEVHQHQGIAWAAAGAATETCADPTDLPRIAALDRDATGMDRAWLMAALLREGRVLVLRDRGQVAAFAALRPFGRGELAGPVVARTEAEARSLLAALLTLCAGRFLRVDLPDGTGLGPLLSGHGLARVGGGVAMARGGCGVQPVLYRRFALAAQSLG